MDDLLTPGFDQGFDFASGFGLVRAEQALQALEQSRISSLVLVDARNNTPIRRLANDDRIILSDLPTNQLAIEAHPGTNDVESVRISIQGDIQSEQIENYGPYTSFGNEGDQVNGRKFSFGRYSVEALPFQNNYAEGNSGLGIQLNFALIEAVKSFSLIDTRTNQEIATLSLFNTLNPSIFQNQINIKANTSADSQVGSLRFVLHRIGVVETYQTLSKIENNAPFALFGNQMVIFFPGIWLAGFMCWKLRLLAAPMLAALPANG
ncbi:MAG: hypothetical protein HC880_12635 [Bacteroidia bacterium]|nr:hypothetical protein [Bacteroidia bacterium]